MTRTAPLTSRRVARFAATLAIAAACVSTSACAAVTGPGGGAGSPAASGAAGPAARLVPADVRARGKLVVAIDPTYPPFETLSADQRTVVGLDPDLLAAIGQRLGLRIDYQTTSFDSIIPGLDAGRYDLAISGMTDTAEREKQVDFVDYFDVGGALVMRAGDPTTTKDLPEALCGQKVGVQTGTITVGLADAASHQCTADGKPAIDLQMFPSVPASVLAMGSDRVDYVWTDSVAAATQVRNGDGRFTSIDDGTKPAHTGIAFPKGSPLTQAVRAALQEMVEDGSYRALLRRYGLESGAVASVGVDRAGK